MKAPLKRLLLAAAKRVTGREVVLLPAAAADAADTLAIRAPYRVEEQRLTIEILETTTGVLHVELQERSSGGPAAVLWSGEASYGGPTTLAIDWRDGQVFLGSQRLGQAPVPGRRLVVRLRLEGATTKRRTSGHYAPVAARAADAGYFEGDVYADHALQETEESASILALLDRFGARGPLLEIGCATGGVLAAIEARGLPAFGIDSSGWAVAQARTQHRPERVFEADAEAPDWPPGIRAAAPFETLLLWSSFEHLRDPYALLGKARALLSPGALLLLQATNCDSLTRFLFAKDWEGYFDWTHQGVDAVGAARLQQELPRLGYRIVHLSTHLAWTLNDDPTHATLRDWYVSDARFRRLLDETQRGDLVLVAARYDGAGA